MNPRGQVKSQKTNAFAAFAAMGTGALCLSNLGPTLSGSVMVENVRPPLSASAAPNRRRVHR
jgi:hypothetical protein